MEAATLANTHVRTQDITLLRVQLAARVHELEASVLQKTQADEAVQEIGGLLDKQKQQFEVFLSEKEEETRVGCQFVPSPSPPSSCPRSSSSVFPPRTLYATAIAILPGLANLLHLCNFYYLFSGANLCIALGNLFNLLNFASFAACIGHTYSIIFDLDLLQSCPCPLQDQR